MREKLVYILLGLQVVILGMMIWFLVELYGQRTHVQRQAWWVNNQVRSSSNFVWRNVHSGQSQIQNTIRLTCRR